SPQLSEPISRPMGLAWLAAALLFVLSTGILLAWPRGFWLMGLAAVVVSQAVIVRSWSDAKFGTLANGLALAAVVFGFAHYGPSSFRAEFSRDVRESLAGFTPAPVL